MHLSDLLCNKLLSDFISNTTRYFHEKDFQVSIKLNPYT